jgi:sulfate adenylyltransferase subunit 1
MDLVDYNEEVFEKIKKELEIFTSKLEVSDIRYIPISALNGDNVVDRSTNMDWYKGPALLYTLENLHISSDENLVDARMPVQYVIRPQSTEFHDHRAFAGRIAGGIFKKGDEIMVLPSGLTSKIKAVYEGEKEIEEGFAPMSVSITLEDEVDISRGDMLVKPNNKPLANQDVEAMVCWFNEKALVANGKYHIKHTSRDARCVVKNILYKVDINALHKIEGDTNVKMNEIARIVLRTTAPLLADKYYRNRVTGSFILVDEGTNETVAAGMII